MEKSRNYKKKQCTLEGYWRVSEMVNELLQKHIELKELDVT